MFRSFDLHDHDRRRGVSVIARLFAALAWLLAGLVAFASPAGAAEPQRSVFYSYDILGRQLTAKFDSVSGTDGVTNSYNGFGDRLTSQLVMGTFSQTLTAHYDGAGRRDTLTHPDGTVFTYAYDNLSRLSGVYQGAGTATPLTTFTYASNGLVASRCYTARRTGTSRRRHRAHD